MKKMTSIILAILLLLPFISISSLAADEIESMSSEEIGIFLAEQARYLPQNLGDGKTSVTIDFDLEHGEFLQLSQRQVLKSFTLHAFELQKEYADENSVLMSKEHIAGEAWLHVIGFKIVTMFGGADGPFASIYSGLENAHLNVNEDRLPPFVFQFIGSIIMM